MTKKYLQDNTTLFDGLAEEGSMLDPVRTDDPQEAALQAWGGDPSDLKRGRRERIENVPIDAILPDSRQPRRAVPSVVQGRALGSDPAALLEAWYNAVNQESGFPYPVGERILGYEGELFEEEHEPGPLEAGFADLVELAASIRQEGLTNPITVVRQDHDRYFLETGERRWLAFHLLQAIAAAKGNWSTIPARVVEAFSIWRQASENSNREDLNAVARARQFALLLMDLLDEDGFQPFGTFADEQDYYAQVADGDTYRIPYGKTGLLLGAMGLKNAVQLRQYRRVLRLPNAIWRQADDENWPELRIREWMEQQESVTTVTDSSPQRDSGTRSALPDDPALKRGKRLFSKAEAVDWRQKWSALGRLKDGVTEADPITKQRIREVAEELREWLDTVERMVGE